MASPTQTNTLGTATAQPANTNTNGRTINLPNFNSIDPQRFFTQALFVLESNNITNPAEQFPYLIEAIPQKILDIVSHAPKTPADPQTKLDDLIKTTCDRCNVDDAEKINRFMKCTRKEDTSFLDFLGTLRRLAHAAGLEENISATLIQHRFMDEIKEGTLKTIAQTNLNLKETLDQIAKLLDQHASAQQTDISHIRKQTPNTSHTNNSPQTSKQTQEINTTNHLLVMLLEQMKKVESRLDKIESSEKTQQNTETTTSNRENTREHSRERNRNLSSQNPRLLDRPAQQYNTYREAANPRQRNVHFPNNSRQDPASCYYHNRFGARAFKCEGHCKWQKN